MIHVNAFIVGLFCVGMSLEGHGSTLKDNSQLKGDSAPLLERIQAALFTRVREKAYEAFSPQLRDDAIQVKYPSLNNRLKLQPCSESLSVKILSQQLQSRTTAQVSCGQHWKLMVSMQIEVQMPAVLTSQPIAKGDTITDDHLRLQERNILSTAGYYFSSKQQVIGFEARRSIRAGTLLRKPLLQAARVVKKGDFILLTAGSGGLRVSIQAEALSDGRIGDKIRVRNRKTRKVVKAKITAAGNAEIVW